MNRTAFIRRYMKGNRWRMALMILSTILAAFLSLLSPLVFSFFIDYIIEEKPASTLLLQKLITLGGGASYLRSNLWIGGLLIIAVYVLFALFLFLRGRMSALISENMAYHIRNDLYAHLQKLPYSYHVKAKTGELVQRCTSDVEQIRRVFGSQLQQMIRSLSTIILACVILFRIYTPMAWIAVCLMPPLFLYTILYFVRMQKAFLASDESEGRMTAAVQENLSGIRVVKAFSREKYEADKFDRSNREFRDLTFRMIKLLGAYWSSSDLICTGQMLLVLFAGIHAARAGSITIGTFFVFVTYEQMILWPIRQLGRILADIGKSGVSIDRLNEILNEKEEDVTTGESPEIHGEIDFSHVEFRYDDGNTDVLRDVTMHINAGQTVAIIGPTGSGKSSLVHLLSRLYDYTGGSLKIDGHELKDIRRDYIRRKVGIVLQEPFLFSKTIYENIRLANDHVQTQDVERAARIADVHQVIQEFDKGYDTLVGEKGVTLSGGQKQRIAIARTILNDNKILIFDDSLSAVDTETDAQIRRSLQGLKKGVTTIIITQRVSSARDADQIFVLEDGHITQSGTHEQLIKESGLYQRIYQIQSSYVKGGEDA